MPDSLLPPTPRELFERTGGPNAKEMFSEAANMGALPIPSPSDVEKLASGFIPSPADVADMGRKMVTGGIEDKALLASAIVTPALLLGVFAVGTVGVIILVSKGGAP